MALAGVTEIFFGIPAVWGIGLIALVAMIYTLLGGMWSVTITDFVQLIIIIIGLVILGHSVFAKLGDGSLAAGAANVAARRPARQDAPRSLTGSWRRLAQWNGGY